MNYFSIPGFPKIKNLSFASILTIVCSEFQVSILDVASKNRERFRVEPRHITMWLMCKFCHKTRVETGKLFKAHWTTVVSACQVVEDTMTSNLLYKDRVYKIISQL